MTLRSAICILSMVVVATSCISHHTSVVVDTPPHSWHEPVELAYHNEDTLRVRDFRIVTYYSAEAPDSAKFEVVTVSPDGFKATDTVICWFPHQKAGRNYFERQTTFRTEAVLRCKGTYNVTFTPTDTLNGVWAVGLNTTF